MNDILSRYPVKRSAMLPLLNLAQKEEGYVSQAAIREIAGILDLTPPQVFETATFYTMLNLKPIGRFHVQVCRSLMCALVGSRPPDRMVAQALWVSAWARPRRISCSP